MPAACVFSLTVSLTVSLTACGAIANDQGSDADVGVAPTLVTGQSMAFDCAGDEGPYQIGVGIEPFTPTADPSTDFKPGATLRWTNCSAPVLTFADDRAQAFMRFGHPEEHAAVVEGPGLIPTASVLLPPNDSKTPYPIDAPGMAYFAPSLDTATFGSTVPIHDDSATIFALYSTTHTDDPTCGNLDGLTTTIAEHPELVATSHPLIDNPTTHYSVRYDVIEGVPPGETIHVLANFPKCATGPMMQLPPLLAAHAHLTGTVVGPVGSLK
jgi:hypothetical protein